MWYLISCLIIEDVIKQKSHSPQIIVPQIGEKHKEKKDFVVVSTSTEEPQQLNNDNHFIEGNDLPEEVRHKWTNPNEIVLSVGKIETLAK